MVLQDIIHIVTAFMDILFAYELFHSFFEMRKNSKKYFVFLLPIGAAIVLINNRRINETYIRILIGSAYIFVSSILLYKGNIFIRLLTCLLYDAIYRVGDMFILGIILIFFPDYYTNANSTNLSTQIFLFGSAAYYIYLLIFTLIFRTLLMKTIGGRKVEQCLLLSGVSFASSVTITVQLSYLMKLQAKEFYIYLLPSVFFIGLVFFIIVFFRIMLKAQENMRTIAVYNNQMNLFSQQYDALVRSNKEIINLRHDWQHHLDIIGGLIYDNETEKLKSYINNLTDIVENNHTTYIGEPVIDIILSGLVHSAKESGVEVDIITDMKFKLNITLTDLCILISNSVDNALEACEKMESEHDKKIWIGIKTDEHYLFYTIKNTYHGEILKISSRILSTKDKPEQHGIGLQSIERIVEKYDGHTVIAENNGIFEIICALENKQITEYAR